MKIKLLLVIAAVFVAGVCLPARGQNNGPVNAVSLDGLTGYVAVPNGVWFSGNFTVEGWVFVRSYAGWSRLVECGNGAPRDNVYLALTAGTSGKVNLGVYTNATSSQLETTSLLPTNQWVHLAATLNGTTATIYFNGVAQASGTLFVPRSVTRTNNYIGRSDFEADGDARANAVFDEIRVWNVARTPSQILADMHRSLAGTETGLIGYWRFDEGAGSTTADSSGHGETATFQGGSSWVASAAPLTAGPGQALSFNPANCENVSVPHQAALDAYPLTVMTWVNIPVNEPGGGGGALINKYTSGSLNGWQIGLGGQPYGWYYRDGADSVAKIGTGGIADGLWHHVAYVVQASGAQIYLDGVLKQSAAWTGTAGACTTTQPLGFGVYPGDSCLLGEIDEVSIWNTALTAAQIQTYMHRPLLGTEPNLVAYYRFDEGAGTSTVDATGNGNNGSLQNGTVWAPSGAPVGAPQVTSLPATSVAGASATLNALVNPEGQNSTGWFQWGVTNTYGNITAANSLGNGFASMTNSIVLTGLATGTYHYQAVSTNTGGTNFGEDMTFAISGAAPAVTNLGVSNLAATGAKLNASVNPNGAATTVWFLYGATTSYGVTNSGGGIGGGTTAVPVSDTLSGLAVATVYHYEVVASNNLGVTYGGDQTFATPAFVPAGAGLAPPVDFNNTAQWGDFNNDGLLDVLSENEVLKNNGNGSFSQVSFGAPRITVGTQTWGDFDNDGFLDVLITGQQESPENVLTQLWHNNGDGTFTLVNNTGLPGIQFGAAVVADFDNDGRPDVLLMGIVDFNNDKTCGIWHNNGNGTFTQISIPGLPGFSDGAFACGDFNNDGYMDFIVTGSGPGNINETQLWRNNGDGTFTQLPLPGLSQIYGTTMAVGDFNNDGYLDFLIAGYYFPGNSLVPITQLWINNGGYAFTQDTQVSLPGVFGGSVAGGDYDNDGNLDILLSGGTAVNSDDGQPSSPITQVWRNLGNGDFANINTSLQGLFYDSALWGDYNNDGRLDILEEGTPNTQLVIDLYQNETAVTNTPPTAPSGLQAAPNGTGVVLSWNAASDAQTPASGLNYNLRVGSSPGGIDIVSPAADPASGFRRLVQTGNAQECLFATLTNLHSGAYYWSVQAIDTAFAGSPFAPEAQFTLTSGLPSPPAVATLAASAVTNVSATLNGTVNPAGLTTAAFFQWGPDTNYGNSTPPANPGAGFSAVPFSDTITGLNPGEMYHYQAVATNIGGVDFGADMTFVMPDAAPAISGESASLGINPPTKVTLNASVMADGTDTGAWFVYGTTTNYGLATATTLLSGSNFSPVGVNLPIGNLNEGSRYHFQLLATNATGTTCGGDATFTVPSLTLVSSGLPAPPSGALGASAAWGDFNNDGFLDPALESIVFSNNNGNGNFTQISLGLPGQLANGTQTWGDLENDGYLDLLSTGDPGSVDQGNDAQLTELWHNNGDGTFTLLTNTGLPNLDLASVAFGDFDNDGKLDILLIGATSDSEGQYSCVSGIWHNNGNGTFTQTFSFGGLYRGGVAVGDFDNDGWLDFIAVGVDQDNGPNAEMWRNNGDGTFSLMPFPGLASVTAGAVAVGDFNNDGKLDFVVSGPDYYANPVTQLWQNNGNWSFTQDTQPAFPGLWGGRVAWGDYNNDGNVDLLFSGGTGNSFGNSAFPTTQLWENLGNGIFTNLNISLPGLIDNGAAWGDYNDDGRLDILLTGFANINAPQTWLIRNDALVTNTPPAAPTGLTASANGYGVVLSWNASSDAQTPSAGLSYNIRVGTHPGGIDIVAPESDPVTGFRRLPQLGNAQERLMARLTHLTAGTYYWSVQAVDSAFAGSPFAPEAHFSLPGPGAATGSPGQITSGSAMLNGAVTPNGNDTTAWFQWDTSANFASNTVSILVSGANTGPVTVSLLAAGLSPLTQYYYRLTASNLVSQSYGGTSNFTTIATVPPAINQILAQPVNAFTLKFTGEPGLSYTLQESTNLTDWTVATNLTADSNGRFQFGGTNAGAYPATFFRLSRP